MKFKYGFISTLIILVLISCIQEKESTDLVNIGDTLLPSMLSDSQPALLGIGDDKLYATSGKIDEKYVLLVTNSDNIITDIWYFDDAFYTPDGYSRTTKFSQVNKRDIKKIKKTSFGSTIIYLRSGWKLRYPSKYWNSNPLPDDATPNSIFKGRDEI
jgi:hypothetical protein